MPCDEREYQKWTIVNTYAVLAVVLESEQEAQRGIVDCRRVQISGFADVALYGLLCVPRTHRNPDQPLSFRSRSLSPRLPPSSSIPCRHGRLQLEAERKKERCSCWIVEGRKCGKAKKGQPRMPLLPKIPYALRRKPPLRKMVGICSFLGVAQHIPARKGAH